VAHVRLWNLNTLITCTGSSEILDFAIFVFFGQQCHLRSCWLTQVLDFTLFTAVDGHYGQPMLLSSAWQASLGKHVRLVARLPDNWTRINVTFIEIIMFLKQQHLSQLGLLPLWLWCLCFHRDQSVVFLLKFVYYPIYYLLLKYFVNTVAYDGLRRRRKNSCHWSQRTNCWSVPFEVGAGRDVFPSDFSNIC